MVRFCIIIIGNQHIQRTAMVSSVDPLRFFFSLSSCMSAWWVAHLGLVRAGIMVDISLASSS